MKRKDGSKRGVKTTNKRINKFISHKVIITTTNRLSQDWVKTLWKHFQSQGKKDKKNVASNKHIQYQQSPVMEFKCTTRSQLFTIIISLVQPPQLTSFSNQGTTFDHPNCEFQLFLHSKNLAFAQNFLNSPIINSQVYRNTHLLYQLEYPKAILGFINQHVN